MTTADKLVSVGFHAEASRAITGDQSNITATGSTISDAYALNNSVSVITAGAATTGVKLPIASKSDQFIIVNNSGSNKVLYPPSGGKLNNGTADDTAIILIGATAICLCVGTIDYSVLSNGLGA